MVKRSKGIRFKDGQEVSFEDFFKDNFAKFYVFTKRFLTDDLACEDIVQETFIAVWEGQGLRYESLTMLNAFIYRTIRNKCLNYVKHHRVREHYWQVYVKELEKEEYVGSAVLQEEVYTLLYKAIKRLTPQCSAAIRLHLQGKTNEEIAATMRISVVTVKSHKLLAYKELRRILKNYSSLFFLFWIMKIKKNQF